MKWYDDKIVELAKGVAAPHTIMYLTKSGSRLHGTAHKDSDVDVHGIFLPALQMCVVGDRPTYVEYTQDDLEIKMWSVQYWLELCRKGDGNALSILFSVTSPDATLMCDQSFSFIFHKYSKLYNPTQVDGIIGFAMSNAGRYGVKGNRLGLIVRVLDYLEDLIEEGHIHAGSKIGDLDHSDMIACCVTESTSDLMTVVLDTNETEYLKILEKQYGFKNDISYLMERMVATKNRYGHRTVAAMEMGGNDWKALSHALRALYEAQEMLENGVVRYPSRHADELMDVKMGRVEFSDILDKIDQVNELVESTRKVTTSAELANDGFNDKFVLGLYKASGEAPDKWAIGTT